MPSVGEAMLVVDDDPRGRVSSMPGELVPPGPLPQKLARMSSRAMVPPGSTCTVVELPLVVPSTPDGVKFSMYFIVCGERFVRRMSDSNSEPFTPAACATAGVICAAGGGGFGPPRAPRGTR